MASSAAAFARDVRAVVKNAIKPSRRADAHSDAARPAVEAFSTNYSRRRTDGRHLARGERSRLRGAAADGMSWQRAQPVIVIRAAAGRTGPERTERGGVSPGSGFIAAPSPE